ncbi:MAG: cytochrome c oxidase subunit 3 family protein [Candidatus Cyclonatronum sp.]|uniref:cytochrome c oxidase subunit 3 family protein n=1 Tax=Cyclonatronum sp. TaxID=3024185 RepID=UPI0025BC631D|nr:cytochrome c oxidase subunit 3 family protein [Cyclonatronum sp.]MCC5933612.1 cytochrome c oxidase subunit 3 family protein [Balneolales bacterium]MCH8485944.1 cytochrome c oxidase subunit 3 family protein [Cyclonatronum sp.]
MAQAQSLENAHVQHHFRSSDQQFSSSKLGMWLFLFTEVMFFGGLFVAYIIYRAWNPELFTMAATELSTVLGGINTVVLIGSSLTCALAIRAAQTNNQKMIVNYLLVTIVLATVFLVIKYFEYTAKFEVGILPGGMYTFEGIDHPKASVFFSIYYMMTGLHGIHVIIGIGLMIWLVVKARAGAYSSAYYTPVEITGLYWHLVDIIWIFLFPLMYLID